MIRRKSTNHMIAWFSDQRLAQKLDLNPPYQRRELVWSKDYQAYFIDTILRNYPAPSIFLHTETSEDGVIIYHVVDGKQRLTTIFEFIQGSFVVPTKFNGPYPETEFDDLPPEVKKDFWNYDMPVQEVITESAQELREAFDRLNKNVARLSKQELRHAAYDGVFIKLMEELTVEPFWGDIGISTRTSARRMKDVEVVSEIFILTMHGIQDGTKSIILDDFYFDYNEGIPEQEDHLRRYRNIMRIISNLGLESIKASRFSNVSDFYSLWAALLPYADQPETIDYEATLTSLLQFESEYSAYVNAPTKFPKRQDLAAYYNNARQGVNKASNRTERAGILGEFIKVLK